MKISISLPDADVEFVDELARERGTSRSAVVKAAVRRLRSSQLTDEYVEAYREWVDSGDATAWETTVGDGLEADQAGRGVAG